jgi:polysaccharide biosynthesis/export protein
MRLLSLNILFAGLALLFSATARVHAQSDLVPPPSEATAPAPRVSTPPAIPGETASSTYRLQPYDLIDVDIYSEEDLHKPARLGADGTILLPLVGSVKVGGMTVSEATDLITKRYAAGYVKNPSVMITVMQYQKSKFSILGQVQKPGVYELPEGAHVNLIEAISMAGGFTSSAAQNAVTVKRQADGKVTIFKVKAADIAQNAEDGPFEILAGDTIVVAAPEKSNFSILGQVQKPGLYEIAAGTHVTIIDALSLAGGYTAVASQNDVLVKRMVNGKLAILKINVEDMMLNSNAAPFEIQAGDSVVVQFRNASFSILGQVQRPGVYEIPEGAHTNIIEAILMAGGYTRSAAQNSVTVKRVVDGKLKTIKVRAGDMAEDADLVPFEVQPGDIVKVNESWY